MAIAEEILYQEITFHESKPLQDCRNRNRKIALYCKQATFAFGTFRAEDSDDSELEIYHPVVPDLNGDAIFNYLNYLPRVQYLEFYGDRDFSIGRFAYPAHGFPCLKTLCLEGSVSHPLNLHLFAAFLQCQTVTALYGLSIVPDLGRTNTLSLQTLVLSTHVFSLEHAEILLSACESLQRFEIYFEDVLEIDDMFPTINPHQLITALSPHKETLQYLRIDYEVLPEMVFDLPLNEPCIIGNKLAAFTALNVLIIEYDAFFGGETLSQPDTEQITEDILPASIRELHVINCHPAITSEHSLNLIIGHMKRHPALDHATVGWLWDEDEKDQLEGPALRILDDARKGGLDIRTTYLNTDKDDNAQGFNCYP